MEKYRSKSQSINLKNRIKELREKNKGITLIALVVTILVLLILAGVTINLLFSDTGLLKKAQQVKNTWENAENTDKESIGELTNQINGISTGGTSPEEPEQIANITTLTEIQAENTKGRDIYGNVVMVPKGFKVVTSEGTTVPEGIVVEDGTGTGDTTGNQFVWIPVGTVYKNTEKTDISIIQLGRYTFDSDTENEILDGTPTPIQLAYTDDNPTNYVVTTAEEAESKNAIISSYYLELSISRPGVASTEIGIGENATAKKLAGFVNSVKDNGGYYIARYEASYGSGYNSSGTTDAERYANAKPLSKVSTSNSTSGMTYDTSGKLWNWITQINSSKVSQNMYANDNNVGVESDLVNSYAWDTAIVFIQKMDETNRNYANKTDGNGILKNTGETGDKVCNIYDMAANISEWTTEYSVYNDGNIAYHCTYRGCVYETAINNAVYRGAYDATINHTTLGFRPLIYIK